MNEDLALTAFLGHLDVIRRTHQLNTAQTVALLQTALAGLQQEPAASEAERAHGDDEESAVEALAPDSAKWSEPVAPPPRTPTADVIVPPPPSAVIVPPPPAVSAAPPPSLIPSPHAPAGLDPPGDDDFLAPTPSAPTPAPPRRLAFDTTAETLGADPVSAEAPADIFGLDPGPSTPAPSVATNDETAWPSAEDLDFSLDFNSGEGEPVSLEPPPFDFDVSSAPPAVTAEDVVTDPLDDDDDDEDLLAAASAAFGNVPNIDSLLPEITVPDAAAISDVSAPMGHPSRSAPRFRSRTEVDVVLEGRGELRTLWTRDISKGGLFVTTNDPPPSGTIVTVKLETPDGGLSLRAEVVHVLDPQAAVQAGIDAGVGLQFVDLDPARRNALEQYIDGLAQVLEDGSQSGPAIAATADKLQVARTFLRKVDDGDLYGALRIAPEASDDVVRDTIAAQRALFSDELDRLNEADRGRVERAGRVLERIQKVLLEPIRRIDFDFRQDIVRADFRIANAAKTGDDLASTRAIWERIWPERLKEAAEVTAQAVAAIKGNGDFASAVVLGQKALALDPFNLELLHALRSWEVVVSLPDAFAAETVDTNAWLKRAKEHHIDLAILRGVWQHAQPEKVRQASEHARRAMAAEGVSAFPTAVDEGHAALSLDPFNQELRHAIERWSAKAAAPA